MGGFASKLVGLGVKLVEAAKTWLKGKFGAAASAAASAYEAGTSAAASAAASAYEAVKSAAAVAIRWVVELVRRLFEVVQFLPKEAKIAIAVVAVLAVFYLSFFCSPAGASAVAMMKAPGGGGLMIFRAAFLRFPKLYFSILHSAGPASAVACLNLSGVLVIIMSPLL